MNRLLVIATFILSFTLTDLAKGQQAAPPAQPNLNIHRDRHELKREKYRELSHELRLEIHRDRRELRHLHRMMRREMRHRRRANRPLRETRR